MVPPYSNDSSFIIIMRAFWDFYFKNGQNTTTSSGGNRMIYNMDNFIQPYTWVDIDEVYNGSKVYLYINKHLIDTSDRMKDMDYLQFQVYRANKYIDYILLDDIFIENTISDWEQYMLNTDRYYKWKLLEDITHYRVFEKDENSYGLYEGA